VLIGRPGIMAERCERYGLPIRPDADFDVCNPEDDPRFDTYWRTYHELNARDGVTPDMAKALIRSNHTAIAAVMVHRGEAESLICGQVGQYLWHLDQVRRVLCHNRKRQAIGALSVMLMDSGPLFIADTQVHPDPTVEELVSIAKAAAIEVRHFGIKPRAAFISASNFGDLQTESSAKMRAAVAALRDMQVDFTFEGEMTLHAALDPELRAVFYPDSALQSPANLLIMPSLDAASSTKNALKCLASGLEVGPILMGLHGTAHIVTPSITTRGLLNVAALASAGEFGASHDL
ncbi:MAG: phosphate acyltransferase, partial [Mangrovicoccus sp.]